MDIETRLQTLEARFLELSQRKDPFVLVQDTYPTLADWEAAWVAQGNTLPISVNQLLLWKSVGGVIGGVFTKMQDSFFLLTKDWPVYQNRFTYDGDLGDFRIVGINSGGDSVVTSDPMLTIDLSGRTLERYSVLFEVSPNQYEASPIIAYKDENLQYRRSGRFFVLDTEQSSYFQPIYYNPNNISEEDQTVIIWDKLDGYPLDLSSTQRSGDDLYVAGRTTYSEDVLTAAQQAGFFFYDHSEGTFTLLSTEMTVNSVAKDIDNMIGIGATKAWVRYDADHAVELNLSDGSQSAVINFPIILTGDYEWIPLKVTGDTVDWIITKFDKKHPTNLWQKKWTWDGTALTEGKLPENYVKWLAECRKADNTRLKAGFFAGDAGHYHNVIQSVYDPIRKNYFLQVKGGDEDFPSAVSTAYGNAVVVVTEAEDSSGRIWQVSPEERATTITIFDNSKEALDIEDETDFAKILARMPPGYDALEVFWEILYTSDLGLSTGFFPVTTAADGFNKKLVSDKTLGSGSSFNFTIYRGDDELRAGAGQALLFLKPYQGDFGGDYVGKFNAYEYQLEADTGAFFGKASYWNNAISSQGQTESFSYLGAGLTRITTDSLDESARIVIRAVRTE